MKLWSSLRLSFTHNELLMPSFDVYQFNRSEVLHRLREEFVNQLWMGLSGLTMLLVPISVVRASATGWMAIYTLHIVMGAIVIGIGAARQRLSLKAKGSLFVAVSWLLAAAGILNFGMAAPALWWLISSLVIILVVYGKRIGLYFSAVAMSFLLAIAISFVLGWLHLKSDLNQLHNSAAFWVNYFISIATFLFIVVQSLNIFHQSAISSSLYRFQQWIDDLGLGVMILGEQKQILYWNLRAKSLLEHQLDDRLDIDLSQRFSFRHALTGASYPQESLPITRAYSGESSMVDDIEVGGITPYKLQIWARPTHAEDGKVDGVVVTIDEISQRKLNERMKSEFVGMVSHELRTPMTSIRGALGILRSGLANELSDKAKTLVNIAHSNTERLLSIINDILDMQKIEAGRMDFQFERLCLNALLQKSITEMAGYAEQYKVRLRFNEPTGAYWVKADKDRIQQVLANLISNAVKFSPAQGAVTVEMQNDSGMLKVVVIDKGPGIPEEFKKRIFQPFSQSDSSSSRAKAGTGLGLVISKVIVEQHMGQIGFVSAVGEGTSFYFTLPIDQT